MRVLHNGIGNNFGLVGKNIRRYLATTALTAAGIAAIASPAMADNWTDHVATEGSISIDSTVPNTTNITQHTDFTKVQGDGDINAGWTVNVAQPSSSSKYVLYDTENDPTMIMGALNANGEIYIFDKNGVIFGKDSQVNVGAIVASTGTIADQNIKENKLVFENVGGPDAGAIINDGTITVGKNVVVDTSGVTARTGGFAAFVAPTVINNGVIKADVAPVILAAGEKVAIDLYGDNLVSITADDALEEALIINKGAIEANGGTVALSAQAAKNAVDNVINMDGVIDVSSVSTKGGKIILGGGDKGVVNVTGALKAGNKGDINVTGQTINVAKTAEITNGDDSNTYFYGLEKTDFGGTLATGRNSVAEVSGNELALRGRFDLGEYSYLTFDPATLNIDDAAAASIVSALNNNNVTVDVAAQNLITVNSEINSSAQTTNSILKFKDEDANNNLLVELNAKILLGANQTLTGEATMVNVGSAGKIQNGIDLSKGGAVVNVAAGTYNESVTVNKSIVLNGAKKGVHAHLNPALRGTGESIIKPNSPGILVTADNVTIDGFTIDGADNGIEVVGADRARILNNIITNSSLNGILISDSDLARVFYNSIDTAERDGIAFVDSDSGWAEHNKVSHVDYNGISSLNGTTMFRAHINTITDSGKASDLDPSIETAAIWVENGPTRITGSIIDDADRGIFVKDSSAAYINTNLITNTNDEGIFVELSKGVEISKNRINKIGTGPDNFGNDAIRVKSNGEGLLIQENLIGNGAGAFINGNGIRVQDTTGGTILKNRILTTTARSQPGNSDDASGIYLVNSSGITAQENYIRNADWDGIKMAGGGDHILTKNDIAHSTRIGIYGEGTTRATVHDNDVFDSNLATHGGIELRDGEKHKITKNTVWNDAGSTGDHGIVLAVTADNSTVSENEVHNVKGNGIYVEESERALVEFNNIHDIGTNGILFNKADKGRAFDNTITDIARDGIAFVGSDSGWAQHNYITHTGYNGISSLNGTTMFRAHVNTITDSGKASDLDPSIETAAIWVENGPTRITGNIIEDADRGIFVKNAASAYINTNRVLETSDEGIFVELSKGVEISKNRINKIGTGPDNFENDAIRVKSNGEGLLIQENLIGNGAGAFINGNGIRVQDTTGGTILKNRILTTTARSQPGNSDDASGIYLVNSSGITAQENYIRNADWDGIKMAGGGDHILTKNDIAHSTRIGIYGEGTTRATVHDNDVFDSNLATHGGIELRDGEGHLIDDNDVWNDAGSTGDHGIVLAVNADNSTVSKNRVHDFKGSGIVVENSGGITKILTNKVTDVLQRGLYVSGPSNENIIVSGNTFTNFDTGAEFESGLIDLTGEGNSFTNGNIGLRFAPYPFAGEGAPSFASLNLVDDDAPGSTPYPTAPTNFGGTIGKQTFTGFTEEGKFYVYLADGAFTNEGTPIWLNGLNSTYDGITPSLTGGELLPEDLAKLEARFRHHPDAGAESTDIFWFGFVSPDDAPIAPLALIAQEDLFNTFDPFNGDITGLNVRITGLPSTGVPGGTPGITAPPVDPTDPNQLANIETAAGGDSQSATDLANIETEAGGEGSNQNCWSNAISAAAGGQTVNVVYGGSFDSNLETAAACGTSF